MKNSKLLLIALLSFLLTSVFPPREQVFAFSSEVDDPPGETILTDLDDTLQSIAANAGVSMTDIARLNGIINPSLLPVNTNLILPSSSHETYSALSERPGDLTRLAVETDVNPYTLMLLNDLADLRMLAPDGYLELTQGGQQISGLDEPWESVRLIGTPLTPGTSAAIEVYTTTPGSLAVTFLEQEMPVLTSEDGIIHESLFGINRLANPGEYHLTLTFTEESGAVHTLDYDVPLNAGLYSSEVISLRPEIEEILGDDSIVQGELYYISSSMTGFTPEQHWSSLWMRPCAGVLTSTFGTNRRYDNTDLNTYHSGTDLATDEGTPVFAPAGGRVVDTGELDIRGYIVILDHGRGVYSGYWHLSSIQVRPGDFVTPGQIIGTVGNTGASTSAHLHWEMRVNGVLVDATQWLRVDFP